jgi:hypothetical protein
MIDLGQCTASLIRIVEALGGAQECRAATHASRLSIDATPSLRLAGAQSDIGARSSITVHARNCEVKPGIKGWHQLFELTGSTQVSAPFVE